MIAVYENDLTRGPGYGLLRLENSGFKSEELEFALIRSGDHKSLHPEGWEDTEYRLIPDGVILTAGAEDVLYLAIGPKVVRQLDELETYRIVLFSDSGPAQKGLLELSGIIYPPDTDRNFVEVPFVKPAQAEPEPAEPEPLQDEPEAEPEQEEPEETNVQESDPEPNKAKPFLPYWLLALFLVLFLAAGILIWHFLLRSDKEADLTAEPPAKTSSETPAEAAKKTEPAPKEEPPAKEEPAPAPAKQLTPMEEARELLRRNAPPEEALALGRKLSEAPEGKDAAFLLLESAAEKGNSEAMFGLAVFYDPLDNAPKGSIKPDAEMAWFWYTKVEQAGGTKKAEASNRKQKLRAWLEDEIKKGSAEAQGILNRIK